MGDAKSLFDEILSPFTIKPILDYTFQPMYGKHTLIGSEFLSMMINNLFISEPKDAVQDVMEVNFGFEVFSVAGMAVEKQKENKEEENKENEKKEDEENKQENKNEDDSQSTSAGGESSALLQE